MTPPAKTTAVGDVYGLWTVVSRADNRQGKSYWLCECVCGQKGEVRQSLLRSGLSYRCRHCCRIKHGHACHRRENGLSREYIAWQSIRQRCNNANTNCAKNYIGRGIKVCERWETSFANFFADMGAKPSPHHSIDRFPDMNGDYEPGNCRWATKEQQANNNRRNRIITIGNLTLTLAQWLVRLNMRRGTFYLRIGRGLTDEQALLFTDKRRKQQCA